MFSYAAIFFVLLGLGLVAWMVWRLRHKPPPARGSGEADRIRRKLAVLKVAHTDGKVHDDEYDRRRHALALRLADLSHDRATHKPDKPPLWALGALAVVSGTLGVGLLVWSTQSSSPAVAPVQSAAPAASAAHPLSLDRLERAVAQSRQRVSANAQDAGAWAMLAHSYDMLGRYTDAGAAYAKLIELKPADAQVLADAADSMALARGRRFEGEPMRLIRRALELDPNNLKALSLAGAEAFGRNDAAQAIAYWQRARTQVTDAALSRELDDRIAEARSLKERARSAGAAPLAPAASGVAAFVSGRIVLADRLKSKISANDALFVFARPADGSRMPVALVRRRASELPIEFELDDSMAMVPDARLSKQSRVIVGARISKRGDASPKPGDLQGFSVPVAVGTQGLRVEISEVVQ
jgi:cytochrome c-type biogenesis protein CcmH